MDLKRLFYHRSIAVVGASPNLGGGKLPFYQVLLSAGYRGDLYPVNPAHKEIKGVKVYSSLDELPNGLDLAICSVPSRLALQTLETAVKKNIRFVHFFTSGFSEIGNVELEDSLVKVARKGVTRIIGPNCIGVHCTESKVTFEPFVRQEGTGKVAFLSQSGGVTNIFMRMAHARGIEINKVVSYGNQADLRVEDYLEYFAQDKTVMGIAGYIEDIKDGKAFLDVLKKTTPYKPLVFLKGGSTHEGAKAAASHTGAMAVQHEIWSAAMLQHRCIEVKTLEQLIDVLMMVSSENMPSGPRVGFLGAGGGTSVLLTDFAVRAGLAMPELQRKTQEIISKKITNINTSTTNPVDLGAFGFDFEIMVNTMKALDNDDHIDTIIPYFSIDFLSFLKDRVLKQGMHDMIRAMQSLTKSVIPVLEIAAEDNSRVEELRIMFFRSLRDAGFPVYGTTRDAARTIACVLNWKNGCRDFSE